MTREDQPKRTGGTWISSGNFDSISNLKFEIFKHLVFSPFMSTTLAGALGLVHLPDALPVLG